MPHSPGGRERFLTTRWSLIISAQQKSDHGALGVLCEIYWYPIYAFIRRQGSSPGDAEDLTQAFFVRMLEKQWLAAADRDRGKFRSFLLASVKNFLENERERLLAQKRGGNAPHISLQRADGTTAEELFRREEMVSPGDTPEELFHRRIAIEIIDTALEQLRTEWCDKGPKGQRYFEVLSGFLEPGEGDYEAAAADLRITVGNARVIVRRLRMRFAAIVRALIDNMDRPGPDQPIPPTRGGAPPASADAMRARAVDDEIRFLINAVARR